MRTANMIEEARDLLAAIEKEAAELAHDQRCAREERIGRALRDPESYYARMVRLRELDNELYYLSEVWDLP